MYERRLQLLAIGETLRLLRRKKGLTQSEFASKIGCTQASYSRLECGKQEPKLAHFQRVAAGFDKDIGELERLGIEVVFRTMCIAKGFLGPALTVEKLIQFAEGVLSLRGLVMMAAFVVLEEKKSVPS